MGLDSGDAGEARAQRHGISVDSLRPSVMAEEEVLRWYLEVL